MHITTARTRQAPPDAAYNPIAPDGTWQAEWPPEVWLVKHRLHVLGYRCYIKKGTREDIEALARHFYVERYGHEPPRRGSRRSVYTIVFEHDRVQVIDDAAAALLGNYPREETTPC
jgi:hypothetical protein